MPDDFKQRAIVARIIENINAGKLETAKRETLIASFLLKEETREYLFSAIERKKKFVPEIVQKACEILDGKIIYE